MNPALLRACLTLAWHNLWEHRLRTIVATAGIVFALFLALMQLGLLHAVRKEATLPFEFFNFDVALVSSDYQLLYSPAAFDRGRLMQARAVPGVTLAAALNVDRSHWTDLESGKRSSLLLFGIDAVPDLVADPEMRTALAELSAGRRTILVDSYSHADYGRLDPGTRGAIGNSEVTVAGHFRLGLFFYAEGSAMVGNGIFHALAGRPRREVSLGLLQLDAEADRSAVIVALRAQLPDDVVVIEREALIARERDYFTSVKPTGLMFYSGALIALLVSTAIFMQVLTSDLLRRLPSYATLCAMGFDSAFVHGVALLQSLLLGALGFLPALGLTLLGNRLLASVTHLPMAITAPALGGLLLLFTISGLLSLVAALRRLRRIEPAELFA